MKTIPATTHGGAVAPSQPLPGDAVAVAFDGVAYLVYEPGDLLPTPTPAPVAAPSEVTMRQARLALLAAGKLAQVEAAINALPEPQRSAARIEWDYSSTVRRHQPLVDALAPALGYTPEQLDVLFIAAEAL